MGRIAGAIYPDAFQSTQLVPSMLHALRHRQGDREDFIYTYKNVELGAHAEGVVYSQHRNLWIFFDGILYNESSVRKQLKKSGYVIHEPTLGKILLGAYITWKEHFIKKCVGNFSIAVFDQNSEELLLYRDPMGKRPLYWYQGLGHFAFASELKALLMTGLIPQTPNEQALASYLSFGYIPCDMTPIQEVNKLLPGHYLRASLNGRCVVRPYWSLTHFLRTEDRSKAKTPEEVREILHHVTEERFRYHGSLACVLTGDARSAWLAHELRQVEPQKNIHAYLLKYDSQEEHEEELSTKIATDLRFIRCSQELEADDLMDQLVKMTWYLDEPVATPEVLESWLLAKLQNTSVTLLSPAGSQQFCSYDAHGYDLPQPVTLAQWLAQLPTGMVRNFLVPALVKAQFGLGYRVLKEFNTPSWKSSYINDQLVFSNKDLNELSPRLASLFDPTDFTQSFYHQSPFRTRDSAGLYFDLSTRLPDSTLLAQDRLRGPHNVHWCTPFLDTRVIEAVAGMRMDLKPDPQGSLFLPEAVKTLINENSPMHYNASAILANHWLQKVDVSKVSDLLMKGALVEQGLITPRWIKRHVRRQNPTPSQFRQMWSVLILEIWFRLYIQRPMTYTAPRSDLQELLHSR